MLTGADMGAVGLAFHHENKPRLSAPSPAIVTAAVSQPREDTFLTGAIARCQRGWTGESSSARARARTVSRVYSGSVPAARRSRVITDTPRNSSTWTGEAFSQA